MGIFGPPRPRPRSPVRPHALGDSLFVGPQLDRRGVEELWRAGFRSIVNVADEGEPGQILSPNVEATWAHTFGLEHARLSVSAFIRAEHVERLRRLLARLPRPIYLHSTGGERARILGFAALARDRTPEEALREARSRPAPRSVP